MEKNTQNRQIDPNLGKDSEKILREALTGLDAKGLVLHPWEETFTINDKKVFPFMEICEEYQVPVLVESGYPWLAHCFQVANLAEKFPKLRFIMAHGGQFDSSGYAMTDVDFVMDTHDNLTRKKRYFIKMQKKFLDCRTAIPKRQESGSPSQTCPYRL